MTMKHSSLSNQQRPLPVKIIPMVFIFSSANQDLLISFVPMSIYPISTSQTELLTISASNYTR